jgi:hypothetical protein
MESHLKRKKQIEVQYGTRVEKLENDTDSVEVITDQGKIRANLVIDATGWQSAMTRNKGNEIDFKMVALHGGSYPVQGVDSSRLHFIGNRHNSSVNWIMPISNNGAEVVAANYVKSSQASDWWNNIAPEEFGYMIEWYKKHKDIRIDTRNLPQNNMAFRVQPAEQAVFRGRVIPFGEAAGFNSSLHGQLIDVLPHYSRDLSKLIEDAKASGNWNNVGEKFYSNFIKNPPFFYLLHGLYRENHISGKRGKNPNAIIKKAIHETFQADTQWLLAQENGMNFEYLSKILIKNPLAVGVWISKSSPALFNLLLSEPQLYVQLAYGLRNKLVKSRKLNN